MPLCDLLNWPDPRIVTVCLEGLANILMVGEREKESGKTNGVNVYAQMIDECDGLDKIENLQGDDNNEIYEKSMKMLERYWIDDELEEPHVSGAQNPLPAFEFGCSLPPQGGFTFA